MVKKGNTWNGFHKNNISRTRLRRCNINNQYILSGGKKHEKKNERNSGTHNGGNYNVQCSTAMAKDGDVVKHYNLEPDRQRTGRGMVD